MAEQPPEKPVFRQIFEASTVGIHLVLCIIAGGLIGHFLDRFFGSFPYLSVIFFILGIIAGFREVFRIARKADKAADGTDASKDL
jgi:ATP synthase protein I